ncbi:MAG: AsnC family protein [Deltaproteobacteria bacterium]|nr:AsnC family protein [Deltaproteobacteria bacterium]
MNETDKKILNEIQSDFPITSRPYLELGKRLDMSEVEVIESVRK